MSTIQLGFTIIVVAFLAKVAIGIVALLGHALFFPAMLVGVALIVVGAVSGNKALGGRNSSYLP